MSYELNRFSDGFEMAQDLLDGRLDVTDGSQLVAVQPDAARDLLTSQYPNQQGFYELGVSASELHTNPHFAPLLGRIVLMPNRQLQALSPAVITIGDKERYGVTMLNQPYDPRVGFTGGQHFGLSVKAQTNTTDFGGHGNSGVYEAGHFSTVLVGSRDEAVGQTIARDGDNASHRVISAGVPETMANLDMLAVPYRTSNIHANDQRRFSVFWHPGLDVANGPAAGDYPNAVRLMLGAGVAVVGKRGLDNARRLAEFATRGM